MVQVEYKVVHAATTGELEVHLNTMTAEGWTKDHYLETSSHIIVVFKRSRATQGNK